MNKEYNWMVKVYDAFIIVFTLWKKWIKKVIPHIKGKKILEVSFGSGYLMTQYASYEYEIWGIDYNEKMLKLTSSKMKKMNIKAELTQGNVEKLPYPDNAFDTVINTMAFTGYPGCSIVRLWEKFGDIIKDINALLKQYEFDYEDISAGGLGSVHLFVAIKS